MSPLTVLMLLGIPILLVAASIKRIPEGQAYTLRRVDGHLRTLGAGTHLVLPLIERVAHKIRLFGNVVEIAELPDSERRSLQGKIFYQVLDATRAEGIIDDVGMHLRKRLPELLAAAPMQEPAARNLHLKAELNRGLRERGLLVTRVQLA
ncbi:MAG: hypothetical protein JSR65_11055 [Proteobacteria bacterium]|nr:hypothetical protein [Pseudomonadota bacterium]